MKEITFETKVADLLNDYEGMKDILIKINPKFKKLNNPVLRRTLAKIAGVRQAAIVGGMDPLDLLNQLRIAVGQTPVESANSVETASTSEVPAWTAREPKATIDANVLLDEEENPLVKAYSILKKLNHDDILTIIADFQPEPLIEEFKKTGHEVYCQEIDDSHFITYIKK
jgi:TusA-related sulfurtransferase